MNGLNVRGKNEWNSSESQCFFRWLTCTNGMCTLYML